MSNKPTQQIRDPNRDPATYSPLGELEPSAVGVSEDGAPVMLTEEEVSRLEEERVAAEAARMNRVNTLSQNLSSEATRRAGLRQSIEERWLEDIRQYNGVYDETTQANITANEGSEMFINITRPKVKVAAARLSDMLFPTDDKNWLMQPTPVPELVRMLNSDDPVARDDGSIAEPPSNPDGTPGKPFTQSELATARMRRAKEKADLMSDEIEDQLNEAQYTIKCRKAIHDACLLGTGVIKGPILTGRSRRSWKTVRGPQGQTVRVLEQVMDMRPGAEHIDVWNFFPDMSVGSMQENAATYERTFYTTARLARLAADKTYFRDHVLAALDLGYKASRLSRDPVAEKRDSTNKDATPSTDNELFEAWEYHGPLSVEDLRALDVELDEDEAEAGAALMQACVVFVGQIVVKAYLNPLETGDQIYHVFNFEKDESSIFGFGVPYRMRNAQRMLNASVRALMDNAALSVGPQLIVASRYVKPADDNMTMKARKVWLMTDPNKSVRDVMASFNIDSHQQELQQIITMASRFADEETNLPTIVAGEQGVSTKTLGGMALLNNNANVIQRDTVKNWDDGVTTPLIRAFYDWNMQNSDKEYLKGDYEVDARGSSALLSKEIQAQNLMALGATYVAHPVFGPMTREIALYRKIVSAMHLAPDEVILSDAEWKLKQDNQPQQKPPEVQAEEMRQQFESQQFEREIQAKESIEVMRHQNRMQELQLENQDNLIRYATQERMNVDKLKTILGAEQIKGNNKRLIQADELKFKAVTGKPGV